MTWQCLAVELWHARGGARFCTSGRVMAVGAGRGGVRCGLADPGATHTVGSGGQGEACLGASGLGAARCGGRGRAGCGVRSIWHAAYGTNGTVWRSWCGPASSRNGRIRRGSSRPGGSGEASLGLIGRGGSRCGMFRRSRRDRVRRGPAFRGKAWLGAHGPVGFGEAVAAWLDWRSMVGLGRPGGRVQAGYVYGLGDPWRGEAVRSGPAEVSNGEFGSAGSGGVWRRRASSGASSKGGRGLVGQG